ncbi:MAG: DUF4399 domain-containing protein [Woeseiaceae bacterium]|nr:DUF4399 domain-containing protein [Woeseiaceae bacterium]
MNTASRIILLASVGLAAACGGSQNGGEAPMPAADENPAAEKQAAPEQAASGMPRSDAPADARLYFITPEDGATVSSPVSVEFGLDDMEVVPAGTDKPASGHHHIIVDTDLPPMDMPIPADENHIHFGDGSTSTELDLEPGEHTLQLLLGDALHIPHQPPVVSERITITVE